MANDVLEELLALIPRIDPNRHYWFVRTQGGEYYADFVKGGYIAIGYDEIPASVMKEADKEASDRRSVSFLVRGQGSLHLMSGEL